MKLKQNLREGSQEAEDAVTHPTLKEGVSSGEGNSF